MFRLEEFDLEFGDKVRVRSTPQTEDVRVAHKVGELFGLTTLSVTGKPVIGTPNNDQALHVAFDGISEEFWFAPDLLELVERRSFEMTVGSATVTRDNNGNWSETSDRPTKPWWRFW